MMPSFEEFYGAIHGRDPFPWQSRLARLVVDEGWPAEIGVPTGLGKTATLDIAVWALSVQADVEPSRRTAPTRIWYVVNRRLLVDAASDHADRMGRLLSDPNGSDGVHGGAGGRRTLQRIGDALRSIGGGGDEALFVRRLRGGIADRARPAHTGQPAIICATVPMYGSRLLFRGYGVSRGMWPIEAALAGTDSVVLLDEAHLAQPLQRLVVVAQECDARRTGVLRPPGRFVPDPETVLPEARMAPRLVNLTATGAGGSARFDLGADDLAHPIVAQRLNAAKPTELVETRMRSLAGEIASRMVGLVEAGSGPAAVVGFVNTPATARAVAAEIGKAIGRGAEVLVLTGQIRDPEADEIRAALLDQSGGGVAAMPMPTPRSTSLFVVATQTLEVGADVDFDYLVSETAGVRALTQRLGRLNRLGVRPHARAILVHPVDRKSTPPYGSEPDEVWARLTGREQPVDLSPGKVAELLGEASDQPPYMPELLPSHMWEFAKTAIPPSDAAPPDVFFSGLEDSGWRVSVCWRAAPPGIGESPSPRTGEQEFVEVPIGEMRAFLESRPLAGGVVLDSDGVARSLAPDSLRPGERLILAAVSGGYGHGWNPESDAEVLDLSPFLYGEVLLVETVLSNALGRGVSADERALLATLEAQPDDVPDPERDAVIAEKVASILAAAPPPPGLPARFFGAFKGDDVEVERIGDGETALLRWPRPVTFSRSEALDELSIASPATLDDHLRDVGEAAAATARAVGFSNQLVEAVRRGGLYHDLGKTDPRFQRWLGADQELLAKSDAPRWRWERLREAAGWPRGGRHELVSLQLLDGVDPAMRDLELVRHLIASHHGWGRPLVPAARFGSPVGVDVEVLGIRVSGTSDPGDWRWDQADRFRALCERFGYWGLALLETVVRQADHRVSAIADVQ